jgi:catechol 2,3-dioxygenase-like lactoylglutathione lyase family enzyme
MTALDIDSINHVGMAVRDLERTARQYEAMGFQLTPYSPHAGAFTPGHAVQSLASGNRCVMFARNYLEILASEDPKTPAPRIANYLAHHEGAHIICFNSDNLAQIDRRLVDSGIETSGVIPLQRVIDTPDGSKTAKFERVQFAAGDSPEGYIQAATHFTPEYIYQPRYIEHPNGCYELSDALLVADDFAHFVAKYATYTGIAPAVEDGRARFSFALLGTLTIVDVEHASALLPGSLFPPTPGIAAVTFRTRDLPGLRERLARNGVTAFEHAGKIIVPAEHASGVAVLFEDAA